MIIAGTGHRPDKLGGYGKAVKDKLYTLAHRWLIKNVPSKVISGMALGWDQALAYAALDIGLYVIAAIPFPEFYSKWPVKIQQEALNLLSRVDKIETISQGNFTPLKMQLRNQWMVDSCDTVLALYNGTPGGTANCVKYAEYKGKPVINLWEKFSGI